MGIKREVKLFSLALLFLLASIGVYGWKTTNLETISKTPLREVFQHIEGYTLKRNLTLPKEHLKMLKLDDYTYSDYSAALNGSVNLYIGYYYSANKAYAAHSPTICYPSQGWRIDSPPITGTLKVGSRNINYQEITTSFGEKKELVLYWYQARFHTSTQIIMNKIDTGYNKLIYNDNHHGFVRVAAPFGTSSYEQTKENTIIFIRAFYPLFIEYLNDGASCKMNSADLSLRPTGEISRCNWPRFLANARNNEIIHLGFPKH